MKFKERKTNMKKIICLIVCLITMIECVVPCGASLTEGANKADAVELYYAPIAYGKIFYNGTNETVSAKEQFDTQIEEIRILDEEPNYILKFEYNKKNVEMVMSAVNNKMNNENKDHYSFAVNGIKGANEIEVINVSLTLCANEHDLLPVNQVDMIDAAVLTIVCKIKNDIYYWQTSLDVYDAETQIRVDDNSDVISRANEYYFVKNNGCEAIYEGQLEDQRTDQSGYNADSVCMNMNSRSHNPYYYEGVSDTYFQSLHEYWGWRNAGSSGMRFYWYTYQKFGSNNYYTTVLFLETEESIPLSYSTESINGTTYYIADTTYNIQIDRTSETIVYYPATDTYQYLMGGTDLVQIVEPSLQVRKTSSGTDHYIRSSTVNAAAIKTNSNLNATAVKSILYWALNNTTYAIGTLAYELIDIYVNATYTLGNTQPYLPSDKPGKLKFTLDGRLIYNSNFYSVTCEMATTNPNTISDCDWTTSVTVSFR